MQEIALIGVVQTLFFSLLLISKKKKETKDYFLVVFLLFVGAELIYRYLLFTISESENRWLVLFDISYWSLFGPFTLLYIFTATGKIQRINLRYLLHLFPLLIGLFAVKDFFFGNIQYDSFIEYYINSTSLTKLALYCWEFTSPVYIIYSLYFLISHKKSVKTYYSEISGRDMKWLTILITGFIIYILISYIIWFVKEVFQKEITYNSLEILPAVLTVYVFFIGYYGYKQTSIFFDFSINKKGFISKNFRTTDNKYVKSGLSTSERNEIVVKLRELMDNEKPYIESDLSINTLATMLDTSIHKLSHVINGSFHKNFFDFINAYRIEEAKRLMKLPKNENYTIISIAYECGYSSKSSFYNAFKKNTGTTPGVYLKKNKYLQFEEVLN